MKVERYRGHSAQHAGLQEHSVGDIYPFIVFAKGFEPTTWHVMHCGGAVSRYEFGSSQAAEQYARIRKAGLNK